jgi:hypothetical protein
MRIPLLALAAMLALGPMLLRTPGAMACSCMAPPTDAAGMRAMFEEDAYAYGDEWIMVTGTASPRDKSPIPYSTTTEFSVDRVYRGSAAERLVLLDANDGVTCGMTVDTIGREFVVARLSEDGIYEPTYCGSFGITPALQAELDAASHGTAPIATDDSASNIPYIPIAFIFGAAAILIAAVFAIRRRDRRSRDDSRS